MFTLSRLLYVFRNTPFGRETQMQSVCFCKMLDIGLDIYIPDATSFMMYFDNAAIQVDLDRSYRTDPDTARQRARAIAAEGGIEPRFLTPKNRTTSALPDIPTHYALVCCPRSISDLSSRIGIGTIGPKVRHIIRAARFPVLMTATVFKAWKSVAVLFGGKLETAQSTLTNNLLLNGPHAVARLEAGRDGGRLGLRLDRVWRIETMGVALRGIGWVLAVVLLPVGIAVPAGPQWNAAIPLVTAFTHRGGPDELPPKARALALFGARHEAVLAAAVVLSRKGLLEHYGERANEIYCLAADEIEAAVLEERYDPGTHTYFVRVRSHSTAADFIRAQITDAELETQEAAFPYNREMEQPVMAGIHPAVELSRAYRHIRRRQWRIAIIYLDHLEKKYPYWGAMFLARAMAFRGMHRTKQMAAALERACGLNNQEACRELDRLAPNF